MKKRLYLSLVAFLIGSWGNTSWAEGAISGGGGNAVVCYNEKNQITSARLLDFYEAETIFGNTIYKDKNTNHLELLNLAKERLKKTAYPILEGRFRSPQTIDLAIDIVVKKYRFIKEADRLQVIDDSFHGFVPLNCKVEQAAVFLDRDNILFDKRIWDAMQEVDRAGLILHEATYWIHRDLNNNEMDSRRARRVTANLLSDRWEFVDVKEGLPYSYTICETALSESHFTMFAVYNSPTEPNTQILQMAALNGDMMLSKKTAVMYGNFPFNTSPIPLMAISGDLVFTNSLSEDYDSLIFNRIPNFNNNGNVTDHTITMEGEKNSYPKRKITKVDLRCFKFN